MQLQIYNVHFLYKKLEYYRNLIEHKKLIHYKHNINEAYYCINVNKFIILLNPGLNIYYYLSL